MADSDTYTIDEDGIYREKIYPVCDLLLDDDGIWRGDGVDISVVNPKLNFEQANHTNNFYSSFTEPSDFHNASEILINNASFIDHHSIDADINHDLAPYLTQNEHTDKKLQVSEGLQKTAIDTSDSDRYYEYDQHSYGISELETSFSGHLDQGNDGKSDTVFSEPNNQYKSSSTTFSEVSNEDEIKGIYENENPANIYSNFDFTPSNAPVKICYEDDDGSNADMFSDLPDDDNNINITNKGTSGFEEKLLSFQEAEVEALDVVTSLPNPDLTKKKITSSHDLMPHINSNSLFSQQSEGSQQFVQPKKSSLLEFEYFEATLQEEDEKKPNEDDLIGNYLSVTDDECTVSDANKNNAFISTKNPVSENHVESNALAFDDTLHQSEFGENNQTCVQEIDQSKKTVDNTNNKSAKHHSVINTWLSNSQTNESDSFLKNSQVFTETLSPPSVINSLPIESSSGATKDGVSARSRELSRRFMEDKKYNNEKIETLTQLQAEYDSLLKKYAAAENTIDVLRLGAKINLQIKKNPENKNSASTECMDEGIQCSHPDQNNLTQQTEGRPESGVSRSSRLTSQSNRSSIQTGVSSSLANFTDTSNNEETNTENGNNSDTSAQRWSQTTLLRLIDKIKNLKEQMENFEHFISENEVKSSDIRPVLTNIQDNYKTLEDEIMVARQQNSIKDSRFNSNKNFNPDLNLNLLRSLDGDFYQLNMQLDDLEIKTSEILKNSVLDTNNHTPFTEDHDINSRHSSQHSLNRSVMNSPTNRAALMIGSDESLNSSVSTYRDMADGNSNSKDHGSALNSLQNDSYTPYIRDQLTTVDSTYNQLMNRYKQIKHLPKTIENQAEVKSIIKKLKGFYKDDPENEKQKDHRDQARSFNNNLFSLTSNADCQSQTSDSNASLKLKNKSDDQKKLSAVSKNIKPNRRNNMNEKGNVTKKEISNEEFKQARPGNIYKKPQSTLEEKSSLVDSLANSEEESSASSSPSSIIFNSKRSLPHVSPSKRSMPLAGEKDSGYIGSESGRKLIYETDPDYYNSKLSSYTPSLVYQNHLNQDQRANSKQSDTLSESATTASISTVELNRRPSRYSKNGVMNLNGDSSQLVHDQSEISSSSLPSDFIRPDQQHNVSAHLDSEEVGYYMRKHPPATNLNSSIEESQSVQPISALNIPFQTNYNTDDRGTLKQAIHHPNPPTSFNKLPQSIPADIYTEASIQEIKPYPYEMLHHNSFTQHQTHSNPQNKFISALSFNDEIDPETFHQPAHAGNSKNAQSFISSPNSYSQAAISRTQCNPNPMQPSNYISLENGPRDLFARPPLHQPNYRNSLTSQQPRLFDYSQSVDNKEVLNTVRQNTNSSYLQKPVNRQSYMVNQNNFINDTNYSNVIGNPTVVDNSRFNKNLKTGSGKKQPFSSEYGAKPHQENYFKHSASEQQHLYPNRGNSSCSGQMSSSRVQKPRTPTFQQGEQQLSDGPQKFYIPKSSEKVLQQAHPKKYKTHNTTNQRTTSKKFASSNSQPYVQLGNLQNGVASYNEGLDHNNQAYNSNLVTAVPFGTAFLVQPNTSTNSWQQSQANLRDDKISGQNVSNIEKETPSTSFQPNNVESHQKVRYYVQQLPKTKHNCDIRSVAYGSYSDDDCESSNDSGIYDSISSAIKTAKYLHKMSNRMKRSLVTFTNQIY